MRHTQLALIAIAALLPASAHAADQTPFARAIDQTIQTSGEGTLPVDALVVREDSGEVHLEAGDVTSIQIHARFHAQSADALAQMGLATQQHGNRLTIGATCPKTRRFLGYSSSCAVDYDIAYPKSLPIDVECTDGNVSIVAPLGDVVVHGINADVLVTNAAASLDLSTRHGNIDAALAPAWSGEALGLTSSTGNVTLAVPSGFNGYLEAQTRFGNVHNDAHLTIKGAIGVTPVHLTTIFGDVTVKIAS